MDAQTVRQAEFPQVLRGYRLDDVDSFLERVATELEAGRPVKDLCEHAQFRQARYRVEDVARFIAQVAEEGTTLPRSWPNPPPPPST